MLQKHGHCSLGMTSMVLETLTFSHPPTGNYQHLETDFLFTSRKANKCLLEILQTSLQYLGSKCGKRF